jgi:flavin reductase (DIM6/NTAB) family NADH-FMN oxidoreductase RutF
MPLDPLELRRAFGCFVTGVTVVTAIDDGGRPRGFTANSFTSVSLDPPLVLVCIARTAGSYPLFSGTAHFAINILSEQQRPLSSRFASKQADKFAGVVWHPGESGSPLIDDTVAWLDCRTERQIDAGDHLILIGRVLAFEHSMQTPLGFCRGNYLRFGLEQQAIAATPADAIQVGAILEKDDCILLLQDAASGGWSLPVGRSLGRTPAEAGSLRRLLDSLGVKAQIEFLYAVFDDERTRALFVYYRGEIAEIAAGRGAPRLVPIAEIPWGALPDFASRSMLERYVSERSEDRFGIYMGTSEAGTVKGLKPAP